MSSSAITVLIEELCNVLCPPGVSSQSSSLLSSAIALPVTLSEEVKAKVNQKVKVQGALANEVGLIILTLLDNFSASFRVSLSD